MLIHIFDDTPHHYIAMRAFFLDKCNVEVEQEFWVRTPKTPKSNLETSTYCYYQTNEALIEKLKQLPNTANILFHGLFELHIWRRLLLLPVVKRCSCVFWGADIYRHTKPNRSIKSHLAQIIHALMVYRLNKVVSLNHGDGQLIAKHLLRNDTTVLPYPLIDYQGKPSITERNGKVKVLVGNSAAESNNHEWLLHQLSHLAGENIEIIMPLNYAGKAEYVEKIVSLGASIFAEKFTPILDMLDKKAYDELLADIDMTLFAQDRQQGLYVVYAMLQMGKPIFLKHATSSFCDLTSLGFNIEKTENIGQLTYAELSELTTTKNQMNQSLMQENFTEQALAPKWSVFLNSLSV